MSDGIPVELCILPGSLSDLQGLAESALDLPESAQLFVDAGYNFYKWEDYLLEIENMRLQVPRKINSKRGREPCLEVHKSLVRKYIEMTISELEKMFPKKIHTTSLMLFFCKPRCFYLPIRLTRHSFNNRQLGLNLESCNFLAICHYI